MTLIELSMDLGDDVNEGLLDASADLNNSRILHIRDMDVLCGRGKVQCNHRKLL
jgi:hypothetical protein